MKIENNSRNELLCSNHLYTIKPQLLSQGNVLTTGEQEESIDNCTSQIEFANHTYVLENRELDNWVACVIHCIPFGRSRGHFTHFYLNTINNLTRHSL